MLPVPVGQSGRPKKKEVEPRRHEAQEGFHEDVGAAC